MSQFQSKVSKKLITLGVAAAVPVLVLVFAAGCGVSIDSGHRGVYYNWRSGTEMNAVLGEGFHWLAPWNKIIAYDVRAKDRMEKLTVLSKDQLQIKTDISIRYRVVPNKVGQLHANVGPSFYRMLIQPVLRNSLRDVLSRYSSIEAYQSRAKIQEEIRTAIEPSLKKYQYFSAEAIMLRNMQFPKAVVNAIELKLAKKQEVEREQYALEKAKKTAERKIVEATASAKAQAILKAELNDTLLRWKGIEATLKLAESKNTKVIVVGSGKDGMPLILGGAGSTQ